VDLNFPNIAIGQDGAKGGSADITCVLILIGTWTMIYNQGFEVRVGGKTVRG